MESQLSIIAKNIRLREIDTNDSPKMVVWRNKNRKYFVYQGEVTLESQEKWLEKYREDPNELMFVMIDKGETVGQLALYNIDKKKKVAEFGRIIVDENHSQQGYATKAIRVLLRYGFNKLKLKKIYLEVFVNNHKAIGLYKKCGFRTVDIIEREISTGEKRLMYCMNITKKDTTESCR